MEKIKGIATDIRMTSTVTSGGNDTSVTTTHICVLSMEGKRVQLSTGSLIHVDEGDMVALVGHSKGGIFYAIAYKNISKGIEGNPISWPLIGFGALLVTLSLGFLFNVISSHGTRNGFVPLLCVTSIFCAGGIAIAFKGIRLRRAWIELNEFSSKIIAT